MELTHEPVGDRLTDVKPLSNIGKSGAAIQQGLLDGERVIVKRIRADDLVSRLMPNSVDRLGMLWEAGVLDELPEGIDHAMIAVERDGDDWLVVQRDVGPWLVDPSVGINERERGRLCDALARLHRHFVGLDRTFDVAQLASVGE